MKYSVTITVLFIILIVSVLVLFSGCTSTTATFEDGKVTVDSRNVVAEQVEKPDGTLRTKIDTTRQSWWDSVKKSVSSVFKAVGGFVDKGAVNVSGN